MSGQMLIGDDASDFGSHLRIRLELEKPTGDTLTVGFVDQRLFGSLALEQLEPVPDGHPAGRGWPAPEIPRSVSHIARDPLDPFFDDRAFVAALRFKKTGVKRALLDQNLISGVGNIYADEALWAARVHYDKLASSLSVALSTKLLAQVRDVFERALSEGGTSFDTQYVNVNGQGGYFSRSLQAYGRAGESCSRCGGLIVRERFMNRSSYRCERCQKPPATR
jgi:formamidopyrimidine-DNA glycosylase